MRPDDDSRVHYAPDRRSPTPPVEGGADTLRCSVPPTETAAAVDVAAHQGPRQRFLLVLLRALSAWTV